MQSTLRAAQIVALVACLPGGLRSEALPSEHQIKAAFVMNFARYVEWPPESLREAGPLAFCVLGYDELFNDLQTVTKGKTLNGHAIVVSKVSAGERMRSCHVLVLGRTENRRLGAIRNCLGNASTLTVSDSEDFVKTGGVIGLVLDNSKLTFEVDLESANRSNLRLSSQLLKLARVVHHEGGFPR